MSNLQLLIDIQYDSADRTVYKTVAKSNYKDIKAVMATYFGFIPSEGLLNEINETIDIISANKDVEYYPYRDSITNKIAHELVDNLLERIAELIEDPARKKRLEKVIVTIHSAIGSLLTHVLTKLPNDKVIDSFHFLQELSVFEDVDGNTRVGFKLTNAETKLINENFDQAYNDDKEPHQYLQNIAKAIIDGNLEHFLKVFSKTLHLGMLKRGAIPVAEKGISSAASIAINKIMPDMPLPAAQRLRDHYRSLVVEGE